MILSLVDVSNNKGDKESRKSYWNTYHCQNKIHTANGKLYGKYCKNRYCTICCCIRKADCEISPYSIFDNEFQNMQYILDYV